MTTIETIIARSLNVDVHAVTAGLSYQDIPEWDSFGHVQLMLALETEFGVQITNELTLQLTSARAIGSFINGRQQKCAAIEQPPAATERPAISRGLSGVYLDRTAITDIDSGNGRLAYRGYDVHDLTAHASFEEIVWLLLSGELPEPGELAQLRDELAEFRFAPAPVLAVLESLKHAHPMQALRAGVSVAGALADGGDDGSPVAQRRASLRLIAQVPVLIAAHHAFRQGRAPLPPQPELPLAHDFLRMLLGREPPEHAVRVFSQDMIVHADHGSNASAFAARVAISTGGGLHDAVTAALAVFGGPLHGGAMETVLRQLDDIGAPENAAAYVRERLSRNEPVAGFGHRVYRGEDPRVRHFRRTARELSLQTGNARTLETAEALAAAMQPMARLGIGANVDLYAGLTYRLLGLPDDLATAIFAAGRMAGWLAQALEQRASNILIRPLLHYEGPAARTYAPRGRGTPPQSS